MGCGASNSAGNKHASNKHVGSKTASFSKININDAENATTGKDNDCFDKTARIPDSSNQGNGRKRSNEATGDNNSAKENDDERNKADMKTSRRNESGSEEREHGNRITMPCQDNDSLKPDQRSPRQLKADKELKKGEEKRKEDEKKRKEKEASELEKTKPRNLKSSLGDKLKRLRNKYQDSDVQFRSLEVAVKMMNEQEKQKCLDQKLFSLDENKYKEGRKKVAELQQEKTRLLNRLSELASTRLRRNNPDIADLSDQNRATKLAEKLSELYDNEWTDTFEATKKKKNKANDEKVIVESLRDLLMFCCETCHDIAHRQRRYLFCSLNMDVNTDVQTSPPDLRLRLKDFQKNVSQHSLKHVKNVIKVGAQKWREKNIVVNYLHSVKKKNPYFPYIDMCTEITWHMQIQDPILVLDFNDQTGDIARFRPYTMSGPQLDYVIWPAMLLHEGGPMVAKGVAQFRRDSDDSEQKTKNQNKNPKDETNLGPKTAASEW